MVSTSKFQGQSLLSLEVSGGPRSASGDLRGIALIVSGITVVSGDASVGFSNVPWALRSASEASGGSRVLRSASNLSRAFYEV